MLDHVKAMQEQADLVLATASAIEADADVVVAQLRAFREWAVKVADAATSRHEAVKAALDEQHKAMADEFGTMVMKLDDIITKLEGKAND